MTGTYKMWRRIMWAIVVLALVLIGVSLTRFNLTALHEPRVAETCLASLSKRYSIYRASRHGTPGRPQDTKASTEKGGSHYGLDCAAHVMPPMTGHNDRRGNGCTRVHLISRAIGYRAIPTRNCFGLSKTESASLECPFSPRLRPPHDLVL